MKEENPEHQNGDPSSSSSTARSPEFLIETKDQSSSTYREKCGSQDTVAMKEDNAEYPSNGPSSSSTAQDLTLLTETEEPSSTCKEQCSSQDAIATKEDSPEYHNDDSASLSTAQDPELPTETQEQRCRSHEAVEKRTPLKMKAGSYYIPHMRKLKGEDAHFICEHEQVVGVADGVGGWAKLGIDAGEYARELMSRAEQAVRASPEGCVDPFQVLATAHALTNALGASTACIMALKGQYIHTVNIGDSGFLVVRDDAVLYHSPAQQRGFNTPYQLQNSGETLNDAEVKSMGVEPGDIIVVATDGVFDNLFDSEVVRLIKSGLVLNLSAERIASLIADEAQRNSLRRTKETPFSIACRKAGKRRKGGKKDDITVVVMFIIEADD
ncbi:unnamed protein product [Musa acuminata subsp. malaccensis]|uniref:Protein phosphatase n=1 Tax=Musa acuminata subsp. malaccensis TaxID=214687 RepID=A0A804J335_MUSAM|nr:PREDICTED: probable protein phosphatase 2C 55 [Musa acuminata subsp. malaccensis]CAG1838126.1 unnamed protein product [Musa acuminata subsp. malaccensis]